MFGVVSQMNSISLLPRIVDTRVQMNLVSQLASVAIIDQLPLEFARSTIKYDESVMRLFLGFPATKVAETISPIL